jgi:CheY-like chemotaxis protein
LRKLLLADDSITIHKVIELILSGEGFEIKTTNNGEDALAAIPVFNPDIVLADVEMPRMNGYLLCEKIKQDPSTSKIPVLLLAGAFEPFDEESAKRVGADGFVIKPFDAQELINKIQDAIESAVTLGEGAFGIPQVKAAEEAAVEEDLWAMEGIIEPAELEKILPKEEAEAEIEKEDIYKAAEEIGVSIGGKPGKIEHSFAEETVPVEEAGILEAELPSKDELKEIFRSTLNINMSALLSSLDMKEILSSSLVPLLKDSVDKTLEEKVPDITERIMRDELKGVFEESVNSKITSLLSSVDIAETISSSIRSLVKEPFEKVFNESVPALTEKILLDTVKTSIDSLTEKTQNLINKQVPELTEKIFKDTLNNSLDSIVKATEKTMNEILPGLVEKTLREELKVSFESLKKEVEKVIWKTIPDLAESIISKEIERIRSEF